MPKNNLFLLFRAVLSFFFYIEIQVLNKTCILPLITRLFIHIEIQVVKKTKSSFYGFEFNTECIHTISFHFFLLFWVFLYWDTSGQCNHLQVVKRTLFPLWVVLNLFAFDNKVVNIKWIKTISLHFFSQFWVAFRLKYT